LTVQPAFQRQDDQPCGERGSHRDFLVVRHDEKA
jgi:hypothetical protein